MIEIWGIVQGVGFRPFVYSLANKYQLGGFVQNLDGTILIEVEGEEQELDSFIAEVKSQPPPLAQIDALSWKSETPRGESHFRIETSQASSNHTIFVSPDIAVCSPCLAELFDPKDRRHRYSFLNCTNCGPRLTIITGSPYDRPRTTMSSFPMCIDCRAEYEDPDNRRFHAQTTACPVCGPQLTLCDSAGVPIPTTQPVELFAQALLVGKIGALKGLGGYHLACDARNVAAVAELRRRKHRDEKPFAIMVACVEDLARFCHVRPAEQKLLFSPQAPIVLLRKLPGCAIGDVAPGNPDIGTMLPYTPLHHLLLRAVNGVPLVMTSGNRSDEPIAYREDAIEKLTGIADLYLTHNRPIEIRCDDSVVRVIDDVVLPIRRSRGYAPRPIKLPFACPRPMLAVGGQLKSTFALAHGRQAFVSHHLGDLDHFEAFRAFERDVLLYQQLFEIEPEIVVHDLHPDYASTRYAVERAAISGISSRGVQHHHAHMASCMAENGLIGPVIGVTFDGTGYGLDGAIWGGEFLAGGYGDYRRVGRFRYVGIPGGEKAVREPWRMALAHALDAGCSDAYVPATTPMEERVVRLMLNKGLNCQATSSVGRLFDAVAALTGVRSRVGYEGQAAIELESLASEVSPDGSYSFEIETQPEGNPPEAVHIIDTRPMIRAIAADVGKRTDPRIIARRFHSTLVEMIARVCRNIRTDLGLDTVVLSGGAFLNALLTQEVFKKLEQDEFRVFRHRLVPPNDGGLALGQTAIAAAMANAF